MIDVEKLARAIQSKKTTVSTCTYALIGHFCTQLTTLTDETFVSQQGRSDWDHSQVNPSSATQSSTDTARSLVSWWVTDFATLHGDLSLTQSSNAKVKPEWLLQAFALEGPIRAVDVVCAAETCFSLLIRLLAHNTVASHLDDSVSAATLATPDTLQDIVDGGYFARHHIAYCFPDAYSWFLYCWDPAATPVFAALIEALYTFDVDPPQHASTTVRPGAAEADLDRSGDWLKPLYEALFPRPLRHALGEYYTPDWLAEYTVQESTRAARALPWQTRFLDPTCGSGTFLRKLIEWTRSAPSVPATPATRAAQLRTLCCTVRGFDISLLAVIMARTNYLFAVIDLVDGVVPVELPVDWFDVLDRDGRERDSVAPETQTDSPDAVVGLRCEQAANRRRGAKRPKADVIVGNPPWVNWEYLPKAVRNRSEHLWRDYALFAASGRDFALAKEDISVLVTYAVIDHDLQPGGFLGFVLRQAMFKSKQNGVGFRRLQIGTDGAPLKVIQVDDLAAIAPFDDATNTPAVVVVKKGAVTQYPVTYRVWRTSRRRAFDATSRLAQVLTVVDIETQVAKPVQTADPTSAWLTLPSAAVAAIDKVLGDNSYRARTGTFTGGANAVFWVKVLAPSTDGLVRVTNYTERAKRQARKVVADLEPDLLYPLLRGSDVRRWHAVPSLHLVCPHTAQTRMAAIAQSEMQLRYPRTLAYLESFEAVLQARRGFSWDSHQLARTPYAIQRVGVYTFAPYKVVWRYISSAFTCAVVSTVEDPTLGPRLVLPNEKLMYISTDTPEQAYYLCGVLSATPVRVCVEHFMNPTSISTHVLDKIRIPSFDAGDAQHLSIAHLCKQGHALTASATSSPALADLNAALDVTVCQLFGMRQDEFETLSHLAARQ